MKAILLGHLFRTGIAFVFILLVFTALDFISHPEKENSVVVSGNVVDSSRSMIGQQERALHGDAFMSGELSGTSDYSLLSAWLKFFLVYALNLALLYYGVQTLGLVRFIRSRQKRPSFIRGLIDRWQAVLHKESRSHILRNIYRLAAWPMARFTGITAWLILFTPAYVVAYSFKTNFHTDSLIFMIGLGCLTNGILVMYAQKFYQLLTAEYRKGYVETALALEADRDFSFVKNGAVSWKNALSPVKHFPGHTLGPVYENARMQYLTAFKEQASFLVTCMIIIEMALNMHGYLGYELLRRLLFRNYYPAAALICGVFLIVKVTELLADYFLYSAGKRHAND